MKKWRKALSCALAFALFIPILSVTASAGYIAEPGSGGYWGYNTYSESELDKYVPVVFHAGDGQSAQSTGYAQFYSKIYEGVRYIFEKGADTENGIQIADPTEVFKPTNNIKFVLHDGILIVTNELTADEAYEIGRKAARTLIKDTDYGGMTSRIEEMREFEATSYADWLATANFMSDSASAESGTTPLRNNPHIETVIFGDNVTSDTAGNMLFNCVNVKNVIWVDGGAGNIVYHNPGVELDYVIWNADGEQENVLPGWTAEFTNSTAFTRSGWGEGIWTGYPATKGAVIVGLNGGANTAAEQAQAKAYVADMDLPDWALAFLPKEVGGTETARTVDEVFDWNTGNLLPNWNDGSNTGTVTETPVTEPETPVANSVTYSDWAKQDIMDAVGYGYIDGTGSGNEPAVTDLLGSDYTRAITRGQFAALAVRLYETRLAMDGLNGEIVVNSGDDVFADSVGNTDMAKAYNIGILGGYNSADSRSGVYVGPDDNITREQAATMLARLMARLDEDLDRSMLDRMTGVTLPFTDAISDWALDSVETVYEAGVMYGTSGTTFSASDPYTTEQSIVTIMRISEWSMMGGDFDY